MTRRKLCAQSEAPSWRKNALAEESATVGVKKLRAANDQDKPFTAHKLPKRMRQLDQGLAAIICVAVQLRVAFNERNGIFRQGRQAALSCKHGEAMTFFGAGPPVARGGSYFEHGADIGVVGRGPTVGAAFEAAAAATFAIEADPAQVHPVITVQVQFEESDLELAFVRWINSLLSVARAEGAILGKFWLRRDGARWIGGASGEPWSAAHERGTEVKGATLTELSVRRVGELWEARCVVDV